VDFVVANDLVVQGDPELLQSALDNLIGNAWKFTAPREQGRIELGVEELDGAPTYFVRDNGAGFDNAQAGKLFAPFKRLHPHDQFEGSGIGLATAQRIIRRHGGHIGAEGKVGEGAVFRFTLNPGLPAPEAAPAPHRSAPSPTVH
jgi:signal transduction histidine kinase